MQLPRQSKSASSRDRSSGTWRDRTSDHGRSAIRAPHARCPCYPQRESMGTNRSRMVACRNGAAIPDPRL